MAHLSTEQAERNSEQQYSDRNSSLLTITLCITNLEHPRRDSIQETKRRNILQPVNQQQRIRSNRKILCNKRLARTQVHKQKRQTYTIRDISHGDTRNGRQSRCNHAITKEHTSPMQRILHTIPERQTTSRHHDSREDEQRQSRLGVEDTTMLSRVPIRIPINQRSTDKCTTDVAQEARDIDEAIDGRRPGVGWCLKNEGVEDVDADYPSECECCCESRKDNLRVYDQRPRTQEEFKQREIFG
jgi:hypothetical protein